MRDFTPDAYTSLLTALRTQGYRSSRFSDVMDADGDMEEGVVVLRHDVDRLPWNSVATARIEAEQGMVASYYFRVVPGAWDEDAIREIRKLGHECGYHYEDMDLAKGDVDEAYRLFRKHLARLREIVPVSTICMHGSPLSRWDNREVWKKYNYRDDDITGEPYFDLDYNKVFYVTDTGRSRNATGTSVRDKVSSDFGIKVQSTFHFIDAIRGGRMPARMVINTHPQRWNEDLLSWFQELVAQNVKNVVKRALVVSRTRATVRS